MLFVVFREGISIEFFKTNEENLLIDWGTSNSIKILPLLLIKHSTVRVLDQDKKYLKFCKVTISKELTAYSTAVRN